MSIVLNFTGSLVIDKEDLNICDGHLVKLDISNMTDEEICKKLNSGEYVVNSIADSLDKSEDYSFDTIEAEIVEY